MWYLAFLAFLGIFFTFITRGVEGGIYLTAPLGLMLYFLIFIIIRRYDLMVGKIKKRLSIIVLPPFYYLSSIYYNHGFGGWLEVFLSVFLSWCAYLMLDKITYELWDWLGKGDKKAKSSMSRFPPKEEADYIFHIWGVWLMSLLPWVVHISWDLKYSLLRSI